MRIDLDADDIHPDSLPRFQSATAQSSRLLRLSQVLIGLAGLALVLAFLIDLFSPTSIWPAVLTNNAATAFIVLAGLQSARQIAQWRADAIGADPELPVADLPDQVPEGGWYERLLERFGDVGKRTFAQIGAPTLWLAGWGLLALASLYQVWELTLPAAAATAASNLGAGLLLLLAFGLLVFERQLTQQASEQWPEARALAQLLRALLATLLLSALAVFLRNAEAVWPVRLAVLIGLLPGLMAVELLIRAIASLFSPRQPRLEPRLLGESLTANLLRWPPQPLQALQDELRNRFGIDLRQVWAFTYMRRAFWPVLMVIAVIGWALTGVREVPVDGRGIYERFGEPVMVFSPGLHLGLPWPFGQVIAAENGQVHELATSVEAGASAPVTVAAEGPAPESADRLWDGTHFNDKSQVIASSQGGQQGFQIVNLDVRFVYRIGLDDHQVLAATYHNADIPGLISSTANRVLVHAFASRTLDELLGEQRNDLGAQIGAAVQHDLQQLDSGVEILATVVEAIHPPAGAANAYHGVQAAQIAAQALISRERGAASQQRNEAQLQASTLQDNANAGAREVNAQALAADRRFSAEQQAFASAGQAFLLEQYLSQLSLGLVNAKLLVVDHRLGAGQAPTLDLRTFALPVDPVSSPKTAP
ncbi:protease modulator HflK [Pseudomonas baltica]|uniref:protease modulator HflK n=1 Tax=Pseudomonas baltica TaxID=2762576 RepID=UPI002896E027|nr:protease modulator HflK [Pseudomonas baltica]